MEIILINLLIIFGVISIIEIPKHFFKIKNTKSVNFISYLLKGAIFYVVGKYLLQNFSILTNTLAMTGVILAFISLIFNEKDSE